MDEAVPGGRAEVPQGAGEDRQEAGQAEERLCCLGRRWRRPLTTSAQPPSSTRLHFRDVRGVWCLVWFPCLCPPRSPAGLPSLTVGARPSDLVFPIQPPRHEITKTMPPHEVSSELASWHFFFLSLFLSATATVTIFGKSNNAGRGTKRLLRCFLSLQSDAEKEDEAFESEKSSLACTCVPATVVPLHFILMFGFCF